MGYSANVAAASHTKVHVRVTTKIVTRDESMSVSVRSVLFILSALHSSLARAAITPARVR